MADPYIFWITEPSLLFYRLLFATACPKKFSDLYDGFWSNIHWRFFPPNVPERIVTGSDLIRTQIVIDGGNAAEKIVFLLKNEMYICLLYTSDAADE